MSSEQEEVSPEELEWAALSASPPSPEDDDGSGADLCPCCLKEVASQDNLCPHCGAPITGIATLLPWEKILAEGYIYRQAVARPRMLLVLIGMWVIFMPGLVMPGFLVGMATNPWEIKVEDLCFVSFWAIVSVAALYQTTRNYFRRPAASV